MDREEVWLEGVPRHAGHVAPHIRQSICDSHGHIRQSVPHKTARLTYKTVARANMAHIRQSRPDCLMKSGLDCLMCAISEGFGWTARRSGWRVFHAMHDTLRPR